MTMTLYSRAGACSMAPQIVMEELGLDYELVMVERDKLNTPEHLAVSVDMHPTLGNVTGFGVVGRLHDASSLVPSACEGSRTIPPQNGESTTRGDTPQCALTPPKGECSTPL